MPVQAGTYLVQNVATGNVLNLNGGSSIQNTQVTGWAQAIPPWINDELWQLEPAGDNMWNLLNSRSGTYLRAPIHADNQGLVGGTPPDVFEFTDFDGSYQIGVTDEPLVLYLADDENGTPVVLQVANYADNGQFWYMHEYSA